jgi:hypothetical protein
MFPVAIKFLTQDGTQNRVVDFYYDPKEYARATAIPLTSTLEKKLICKYTRRQHSLRTMEVLWKALVSVPESQVE